MAERDKLLSDLYETVNSSKSRCVLIEGESGCGKTKLLRVLADMCNKQDNNIITVHIGEQLDSKVRMITGRVVIIKRVIMIVLLLIGVNWHFHMLWDAGRIRVASWDTDTGNMIIAKSVVGGNYNNSLIVLIIILTECTCWQMGVS